MYPRYTTHTPVYVYNSIIHTHTHIYTNIYETELVWIEIVPSTRVSITTTMPPPPSPAPPLSRSPTFLPKTLKQYND